MASASATADSGQEKVLGLGSNCARPADHHHQHHQKQQQQQTSNNQGTQDAGTEERPPQIVSRKRPLPRSFKPVARAGFQPPRAKHSGGSQNGASAKSQGAWKPQLAPHTAPQPLLQRSANQAQPACGQLLIPQQPAQPISVLQRWVQPGAAPAKAASNQRRLPAVLARSGAARSYASASAHALNELSFPAAGMQQAERLCIVPDTFQGGVQEYSHVWLRAVYEELNLQ